MKDKKFKAFSVIRLIFAVLMITEALFLIYCAVSDIFISEPRISRADARVLTCAPSAAAFVCSLISVFEKSGSNKKIYAAGTAAVIIFAAVISLFAFPPALPFALALLGIAGTILTVCGSVKGKITSAYGIICLNSAYSLLPYLRLLYDYSGMDLLEILLTMAFAAFLSIFITIDAVLAVRNEKREKTEKA